MPASQSFTRHPIPGGKDIQSSDDASSDLRSYLRKEMTRSRRNGSWFRLSVPERGLFSLAVRLEVKLSSFDLLKAVTSILKKMKMSARTAYSWLVEGSTLAWALSERAVQWGNKSARAWRNDADYALYLGRFVASAGRCNFTHPMP
ncbi:MAG: hypothetical protein JRN39_08065 [Nitrososphaerota archaeon]|nr:hypothetical protein [Nitrososphaerota archaeon]MDG6940340.1 hypothetical protein [Nitrososphaerota archaeon]